MHWQHKMENNEFKKVSIKICMCCYFDDIIKLEDFDFDNILTYEKSHENILIYDISYRTLIVLKPLRIGFDKMDGFIRIYDGTRYLVLLGPEKYGTIYNTIRYLIGLKRSITYIFSRYYAKHRSWFLLFFNKNHCHCNIFLEKCLYQLAKKLSQIFFDSIIMLRFREAKLIIEKFMLHKPL